MTSTRGRPRRAAPVTAAHGGWRRAARWGPGDPLTPGSRRRGPAGAYFHRTGQHVPTRGGERVTRTPGAPPHHASPPTARVRHHPGSFTTSEHRTRGHYVARRGDTPLCPRTSPTTDRRAAHQSVPERPYARCVCESSMHTSCALMVRRRRAGPWRAGARGPQGAASRFPPRLESGVSRRWKYGEAGPGSGPAGVRAPLGPPRPRAPHAHAPAWGDDQRGGRAPSRLAAYAPPRTNTIAE
jgi:hypothetical protein